MKSYKYLSTAQSNRQTIGIVLILLCVIQVGVLYFYRMWILPPRFLDLFAYTGIYFLIDALRYAEIRIRNTKFIVSTFFSEWDFETYQITDVSWRKPFLVGLFHFHWFYRYRITLTIQDEEEHRFRFKSARIYDRFLYDIDVKIPNEAKTLREKKAAAHSRILEESGNLG